uniref:Radical SAM superfamily protein n=1 Tax=Candidatus Kentrum sp. LPFa TaxID=2126335 RepID=A0A450W403_9GAMM|nr:MAG: Radical SAM superfamily protein [Candidatus Kentron sp. LPFa]
MGNYREDSFASVWSNKKYRRLRRSLLTGVDLTPYCDVCEYCFDGPAWMMQLHMGLHALGSGERSEAIVDLVRRRIDRYDEYTREAPRRGLSIYPRPGDLPPSSRKVAKAGSSIIPEALVSCVSLPIHMDFNTINRCNASCVMYPPALRFNDHGIRWAPYYRLTLDEYKKITDGIRIESAHFVGAYAEPLLNKELFVLIEYTHKQDAFTAITTNATLLSRKFSERLIDADLDQISISLHGATKEVAEAVMRGSDFHKVIGNIRTLQKIKRERDSLKPEIFINFVGQRINARDLPPFIDLAHELGIKYVNFIHLIDGDKVVDKSRNLIHYPDLLVESVAAAEERASATGVVLDVSSGYRDMINAYQCDSSKG